MRFTKAVLALVAIITIGVVNASSASAHNHTITAPCDGALSVSMDSYGGGQGNHITVTLGGSVVTDTNFGANFSGSWTPTSYPATYKVVVAAADSNDDSFTTTDTIKACKETPPSTTTVPTTGPPSTTTSSTSPPTSTSTTVSPTSPTTIPSASDPTKPPTTSKAPVNNLPSTGHDWTPVALVALVLIGAGVFLVKRSTISPPR